MKELTEPMVMIRLPRPAATMAARGGPAGQEGAGQVDVDIAVPAVILEIDEIAEPALERAARHQHVEPAEMGDRIGDGGGDRGAVGEIAGKRATPSAGQSAASSAGARSKAATRAPSARKASTTAWPMPPAAPVMMQALPSSRPAMRACAHFSCRGTASPAPP